MRNLHHFANDVMNVVFAGLEGRATTVGRARDSDVGRSEGFVEIRVCRDNGYVVSVFQAEIRGVVNMS